MLYKSNFLNLYFYPIHYNFIIVFERISKHAQFVWESYGCQYWLLWINKSRFARLSTELVRYAKLLDHMGLHVTLRCPGIGEQSNNAVLLIEGLVINCECSETSLSLIYTPLTLRVQLKCKHWWSDWECDRGGWVMCGVPVSCILFMHEKLRILIYFSVILFHFPYDTCW